MSFGSAVAELFNLEGGYVNNPKDRGGPTKFGVTLAVARAHGYTDRMEEMSVDQARAIAKAQYWDLLRLDEISRLSYPIAFELFDTGYNCGPGTAGRFLQRALNALNRERQDYPDVDVDGLVGPLTVHALRLYLVKRTGPDAELVLLRALNSLQSSYYIELAERDPSQEAFVFGWLRHRVVLEARP